MKLIQSEKRILISLGELVSIARRRISPALPTDEGEPELLGASRILLSSLGITERRKMEYDFSLDGVNYRVFGYADAVENGVITLVKVSTGSTKAAKKAEIAQARGEGFVLGKMLADNESLGSVTLKIFYANEVTGASEETEEIIEKKVLDSFFDKCASAVSIFAAPEIERVTERVPSMKAMRFPYADVREGQDEFIRRAYRALVKGNTLFACAPTGTGKTVSVIYPAIKALGEDRCDKAFYLTPKGTTAEAAKDCIKLFCERGAKIKAIILSSKEKSCPCKMICRESSALCEMARCNKLAEAVMAVHTLDKCVVEIADLKEIAAHYTVCPYELELAYSELCDVVICDFNYLFDPVVYIRRFFTEGGRYAFLIDEAHNLADRGREMYSSELSLTDIDKLLESEYLGPLSKLREELPKAKASLTELLYPFLKDEMRKDEDGLDIGATHLSYAPGNLYAIISRMREELEDEEQLNIKAKDDERTPRLKAVRDLLYKVKKVEKSLESFDTGYRLLMFYKGGELSFRVLCIDASGEIQKRINKGSGAVFFSATLSPLNYYKSILSSDPYADTLEVDSPFDPEQLSVSIMDRISIRYSERSRTLPAVCRVVAATLSAKRGHYMVFAPSFEYAEALHGEFRAKYPKIRSMLQTKNMSAKEKSDFLEAFSKDSGTYLVGFCVMGGIYSEGIDLAGDSLIGAVVIGIGMPSLSYEREAIASYFEEKYEAGKQYAYIYPGMNRVFQAAGRVIRREDDKGVIVLIDDRFADPIYKKSIPTLWEGMQYVSDAKDLRAELDKFWS
ncbi:MAG: ATP-dependent DNA helicase [Clostridia bacterium]|nr:ATP-dependent DNA helicase [Clostridia bacterium]